MLKSLFLFLNILILNVSNHRIAVSGKDCIVNDINKPYTEQEIIDIADVYVTYKDENISDKLVYDFNDYNKNKTKIGRFKVIYSVEVSSLVYYYELLIVNINSDNSTSKYDDIYLSISLNDYLTKEDIFNIVENKLGIKINNPSIVDSNYYGDEEGVYYCLVNFMNEGKNYEVLLNIDVERDNTIKTKAIISLVLLFTTIITIILIRRRKRKK